MQTTAYIAKFGEKRRESKEVENKLLCGEIFVKVEQGQEFGASDSNNEKISDGAWEGVPRPFDPRKNFPPSVGGVRSVLGKTCPFDCGKNFGGFRAGGWWFELGKQQQQHYAVI